MTGAWTVDMDMAWNNSLRMQDMCLEKNNSNIALTLLGKTVKYVLVSYGGSIVQ